MTDKGDDDVAGNDDDDNDNAKGFYICAQKHFLKCNAIKIGIKVSFNLYSLLMMIVIVVMLKDPFKESVMI